MPLKSPVGFVAGLARSAKLEYLGGHGAELVRMSGRAEGQAPMLLKRKGHGGAQPLFVLPLCQSSGTVVFWTRMTRP